MCQYDSNFIYITKLYILPKSESMVGGARNPIYRAKYFFSEPLSISEIKEILRMTEDGTDEIISTRSKIFQKLNVDVESLPLQRYMS